MAVTALAIVTAGCGSPAPGIGDTTAVPSAPPSTTLAEIDTGDLVEPEVRTIAVDGEDFLVAFVDTPATRARGLMGVEDLGDLDGMLFDLGSEREATFTMRNTLLPLVIVFFAADGTGRSMLSMEPCPGEPCPTYPSGAPARFALEVPAGSAELTADSVLTIP